MGEIWADFNTTSYAGHVHLYDVSGYVHELVLDNTNFQTAVVLVLRQTGRPLTYGHQDWNVKGVTDMYQAFMNKTTFDENIGAWGYNSTDEHEANVRGGFCINQPIGD